MADRVVELSAEARVDLLDAIEWYERQRSGLGNAFLQRVNETLANLDPIEQWIEVEERADRSIRSAVVRRYPYRVICVDLSDRIRVLALAHESREPGFWRRRG